VTDWIKARHHPVAGNAAAGNAAAAKTLAGDYESAGDPGPASREHRGSREGGGMGWVTDQQERMEDAEWLQEESRKQDQALGSASDR
jgi:hypothetical protein